MMFSVRLDAVRDADIIAWLSSLPAKGRSDVVRNLLRRGVSVSVVQSPSSVVRDYTEYTTAHPVTTRKIPSPVRPVSDDDITYSDDIE